MGVAVNAVKDVACQNGNVVHGIGKRVQTGGKTVASKGEKFANQAASNLEVGSKCSPIISQCQGVGEGMIEGACSKVASNGGALAALALIPSTGAGMKSASSLGHAATERTLTAAALSASS